jgi:CubicO group peptidase (beta-lactamase class C family)
VGISPSALLQWLDALEQTGFIYHHLMLLRHGKVAFEIHNNPFRPDVTHYLCSCSKSVAAAAVGFAVAEGLTSLNERIVDVFPEKVEGAPHPYIAAMAVEHLLNMSTVYGDAFEPQTKDWTREFLNGKPDHYPGTVFGYDSIGTHTLCDIVQTRSGMTVQQYLTPRLFDPLGITPDEIRWEFNPGGVNHGGGGLSLTPEAMAKFGQLHLNGGIWNGKQVLPTGWADQVREGRVSCVTCDGTYKDRYGYKFWRMQHNSFACSGLAGQSIIMHPDKAVVFVGAANGFQTDYHYFHKTYFWQYVYPGIADEPVPLEEEAYAKLTERVRTAEVFLPHGLFACPMAARISGKAFTAGENKLGARSFSVTFDGSGGTLCIGLDGRTLTVPFGFGTHKPGGTDLQDFAKQTGDPYPNGCGAAGAWVDERTLVIQSHVIDSLQYFLITCHFGEKAAVVQIRPYGIYGYDVFPCSLTHAY